MIKRISLVLGLSVLCSAVACSGEDPESEAAATDGTAGASASTDSSTSDLTFRYRRSGTGGTTATGGTTVKSGTGGVSGTGGTTATGGTTLKTGTGGTVVGTGGTVAATGGTVAGTGGTVAATGGATGSGRINISASRTTCSAPCAVYFDGTNVSGLAGVTSQLPGGDYVGATYRWNFNDSASPHPSSGGFAVAHVFESTGTYTITANVTDSAGNVEPQASVAVTVTAMSGTTYYVSASGNDSQDGKTTSTAFATISKAASKVAANTTILFRKGDSFSATSSIGVNGITGSLRIGSYSDPAKPSSVVPTLTFTGPPFHISSSSDIVISDLHLVSTATGGVLGFDISSSSNITILRVDSEAKSTGTGTNQIYTAPSIDGVYVFDSHLHNFSGYAWYAQSPVRVALVGSTIDQVSGQDHGFRFQGCSEDSSGNCPSGDRKANFEYVASNTIDNPTSFTSGAFRGDNSNIVVINNYCTNNIGFSPQNTTSVEHVANVLADGNFINGSAGIFVTGRHIVARNNVIKSGVTAFVAMNEPQLASGWIDQLYLFNNTVTSGTLFDWEAANSSGMATIANNIVYTTATAGIFVNDPSHVYEHHNLTYAPNNKGWSHPTGTGDVYGNPGLVNATPEAIGDFQLAATTSLAHHAGANVGAYLDYSSVSRPMGAFDLGALQLH